ncbi:hypothetical protein F5050DRAFT_1677459 [Lentinula boryana]|uniref:Annexin n=1 Tax=Lentinula boryana TaxID=40481 RepID=A0ABQ8Q5Y7_9AGAR|nr:hypothetical protein F5050DRAFT_1677459 [Lentinula boryana]
MAHRNHHDHHHDHHHHHHDYNSTPGGFVGPSGHSSFNRTLHLSSSSQQLPEAQGVPGIYGGGYIQNEQFRDGYNPSYAPPISAYPPPPGPPPGFGTGYAPPSGPPMPGMPPVSGFAPPPGPPPMNSQSYPGVPGQHYGQQQNVIYYLNTPIPPFDGPPPSRAVPGYDANADVERLREAMKGVGTKEGLLIQTLSPLTAMNIAVLSASYRAASGKELLANVESETSGRLRDVLSALVRGPVGYDVKMLHEALSGAGTDEHLLTELIADRSPSDLYYLDQAYRAKYGRSLEEAIKGDLSGKTERIYIMILSSNRPPNNTPVDSALVEADVKALYKAGQGKIGTDEIAFCNIIVNRTTPHLTALWEAYQRQHGKTLSKVIKNEFSSHMKNSLLYIVNAANPKRINEGPGVWRDVKLLEATMKGMGTKDDLLIRRLIRTHWDQSHFTNVKRAYERKYKKTLEARVAGETSGDYKKACVGVVRGA